MVEWESGEKTSKPLAVIAADDLVTVMVKSEDGEITSELLALSCTEEIVIVEWDNGEITLETTAENIPEIPFVIGSKNLSPHDNTIHFSKFKSHQPPVYSFLKGLFTFYCIHQNEIDHHWDDTGQPPPVVLHHLKQHKNRRLDYMSIGKLFSWPHPVITRELFFKKVCKCPSPAFNANCCSGHVVCGTLYSNQNAVDDEPTSVMTLVCCHFYVKNLSDIQKDFEFADAFEDNFQDQGVKLILTCDL